MNIIYFTRTWPKWSYNASSQRIMYALISMFENFRDIICCSTQPTTRQNLEFIKQFPQIQVIPISASPTQKQFDVHFNKRSEGI